MQKIEPLTHGKYYHIYNRGINSCNLFGIPYNYEYFLSLYDKYIDPIADTYAWCLMPNHFHLLVRVKEEEPPVRGRVGIPSQQFSKLFNAYAQAFNKQNNRHGSLFERPFKRKQIENESYLKQLILYIHNNPVHHGFCEHPVEYPWSSYLTCISVKPTKLYRDTVVGWFDDMTNFRYAHNKAADIGEIKKWPDV